MRQKISIGLLALCGLPLCVNAAEDKPRELLQPPKVEIASPITDRFSLRGMYYQPKVKTDLRYDTSAGLPGTQLDAEDRLGLDDELNTGSIEMIFRLRERNRLRVDFFKSSRHGDTVLAQPIVFGDDVYATSDRVVTDLDVRMLGLTYTYSFIHAERFELGAGLGVHLIQAQGVAEVPVRRLREEFDAAGPFPTIALDGTYRVSKRFSISARAQYLGIGVGDVNGSLGIYHADLQFRAWKNLALGVGYTKTTVLVESTDSDFSGRLGFDTTGPEAFVRISF